jgi:ABC-2 type transport system permease protein
MILMLLPFLGSGFVPVDTMPAPVRVLAEHQPFTPVIETVRGLLAGTPVRLRRCGRRSRGAWP